MPIVFRLEGHCSKTDTPKDVVGVPALKLIGYASGAQPT